MPPKKTHDQNQDEVCRMCLKKATKGLKFTPAMEEILVEWMIQNNYLTYDRDKPFLPRGGCGSCKTILYSQKSAKPITPKIKILGGVRYGGKQN